MVVAGERVGVYAGADDACQLFEMIRLDSHAGHESVHLDRIVADLQRKYDDVADAAVTQLGSEAAEKGTSLNGKCKRKSGLKLVIQRLTCLSSVNVVNILLLSPAGMKRGSAFGPLFMSFTRNCSSFKRPSM